MMTITTNKNERKGTAATEFALIIPILLLLTFGTIELCSAMFLRQTLQIAAFEGARVSVRKRATNDDVRDAIEEFLDARDITGGTATIDVDVARTEILDPIEVTVQAPMNGNGILPNGFYTWLRGRQVAASTVMYKEFIHPDYEEELASGS